jgi:mRNA-degrading endonuclease RelE of RelBE toxin-antitoxin system
MNATAQEAPKFVTDSRGKQVGVLLTVKAYERLREAEEELADIRAYDSARPKILAEIAAGDFLPLNEFLAKRRRKVSYTVILAKTAQKQFLSLPAEMQDRVAVRLQALETKPRPADVKKLKGREGWRVRVGDYRVIYEIHDRVLQVLVITIAHRREVSANHACLPNPSSGCSRPWWRLSIVSAFSGRIDPYYLDVTLGVGIAITLAASLNLINGFTGQFSLGHAGFMAVGAYSSAVLTTNFGPKLLPLVRRADVAAVPPCLGRGRPAGGLGRTGRRCPVAAAQGRLPRHRHARIW